MGKLSSIIIIAMLLHTTLLVPNLYSDINDGLVAYYPFNGNANDESGNGNHGTVYGAVPTQDFNGNMNSAYSFDGTNDYIQVSDSNSLDLTTSLTFSAWIKIDSYAGDYPYLLSKEPYNYEPYRFYFQSNQTIFGWASSATIRRVAGVSRGVPIAEWTHVAIIFNSGNIKFYHNGESISSINSTITSLYKTNGSLYIGTRTPANNALDGILDEILIYNRALSATEIQKLADNDSCEVYGGDTDNDYICDENDNCPNVSNINQADADDDNVGDVCDDDIDGDSILNTSDNCPVLCNPNQTDADGDGIGDACDCEPGCGGCGQPACEISCDIDNDHVLNAEDNCPVNCNTQQLDGDNDGIGDVCDAIPGCGGCGQPACETPCGGCGS